ncbi:hypothetical protein [Pseudomonas frederiksbergensis]|uniref:hypothetical protein n=1 Tax=Pseudomonas frederiksbergensis TaxID=104087 RepID=UPI003D1E1242
MRPNIRKRVIIFSLVVLLSLFVLLGLKVQSSWTAKPLYTDWNDSGECYIAIYTPEYKVLGAVAGRIFKYFSSPYFYRVYTKKDEMLKTSEWSLWMREGNAGVAPEFRGEMIVYPGSDGWESWIIPQCR